MQVSVCPYTEILSIVQLTLAAASIVALTTWELQEAEWDRHQAPSLRPSIADAVMLIYDYAELVGKWTVSEISWTGSPGLRQARQ